MSKAERKKQKSAHKATSAVATGNPATETGGEMANGPVGSTDSVDATSSGPSSNNFCLDDEDGGGKGRRGKEKPVKKSKLELKLEAAKKAKEEAEAVCVFV